MTAPDAAPLDDDRHETPTERMDRNWNELLQELRVTQTGVQILTGFLLTVPFQQRFTELDAYQRNLYLELVVLAVVTTGLILAPVSLHRILFRKRLKRQLVTAADRMARVGLATLALVLAGTSMLVFDVVVGRTEGLVAGSVVLVALVALWVLLPLRLVQVAEASAARAAPHEGPPHDASR